MYRMVSGEHSETTRARRDALDGADPGFSSLSLSCGEWRELTLTYWTLTTDRNSTDRIAFLGDDVASLIKLIDATSISRLISLGSPLPPSHSSAELSPARFHSLALARPHTPIGTHHPLNLHTIP